MRDRMLRAEVTLSCFQALRVPGKLMEAKFLVRACWRAALKVAKYAGMFRVSRYLTKNGLRILCYHGIAVSDEYKFRGTLFVRRDFFRRRIESLLADGYPLLPLGSALTLLDSGSLPPCATVISMDDGWQGLYSQALPIICDLRVPIVLYAASYYIQHRVPVYSVTVSFLFWRTNRPRVELPRQLGSFCLNSCRSEAEHIAQQYGIALSPDQKLIFLKDLAAELEVSFGEIADLGLCQLVTPAQLASLAAAGVDVQLHTHNHEWSLEDPRKNEHEINTNRHFLMTLVPGALEHFCYPSGVHGPSDGELLSRLGVKSAVTIEPGLNYVGTPRYDLCRIIDGERVSDIEFAAEMSGFMELVRALRARRFSTLLKQRFSPARTRNAPLV